jgi:hypothetical protein
MTRFIVLAGVLALLAVGATTLAKVPRPAVAHHEPLDPAILHGFLQHGRDEMALP